LTYSAVSNGAGAPALTANSLRLGYVVTGGSTITSAVTTGFDSLRNTLRNLIRNPAARSFDGGNPTSVPNLTWTSLSFGTGTTTYDNDGFHSESVNNTRFTVQHAGWYTVVGGCQYASLTASVVYVGIVVNGSSNPVEGSCIVNCTTSYPILSCTYQNYFNVNDYVEVKSFQSSGSSQSPANLVITITRTG